MFLANKNYHQRGVTVMAQAFLPFKYEKEKMNFGHEFWALPLLTFYVIASTL